MKYNIALLSKKEQKAILTHKKACLRRYYESMDKFKALMIKSSLERHDRPTTTSRKFIKRVNFAKGYDCI